jgi:putative FmdB family regulatory protein
MPTYEYACRSCGHHLEIFQSFSEEPLTTCPNCEGDLRKVFGSIGIVLKGSGFYRTDSRAPAGAKTATHERKDAASGSDGGSGAPAAADGSSASTGASASGASASASTPPAAAS